MLGGEKTEGRVAVLRYPLLPRTLVAPIHTHRREDECAYVVEGEVAGLVGGNEVRAGPGEVLWRPRGLPHTLWNQGSEKATVVDLITPAGFERYFLDLAELLIRSPQPQIADYLALLELYEIDVDLSSLEWLTERYNLHLSDLYMRPQPPATS